LSYIVQVFWEKRYLLLATFVIDALVIRSEIYANKFLVPLSGNRLLVHRNSPMYRNKYATT